MAQGSSQQGRGPAVVRVPGSVRGVVAGAGVLAVLAAPLAVHASQLPSAFSLTAAVAATSEASPSASPATASTSTPQSPAPPGCVFASAAAAAGEPSAAASAYVDVLRSDPSAACAVRGLQVLHSISPSAGSSVTSSPTGSASPTPCAVAVALESAGATAEARSVLVDAVKSPGAECSAGVASGKLKHLDDPGYLATVGDTLGSWLRTTVMALLGALGLGLAIFALWLLLRWGRLRRLVTRLPWLRPQLVVGPFDEGGADPAKPGALLAALVAAAVASRSGTVDGEDDEAARCSLSVVDQFQELDAVAQDLTKISATLAPASTLAKLLTFLVRPRRWALGGALRVPARRPTLTAKLADGGRLAVVQTLDLPAPSRPATAGPAGAEVAIGTEDFAPLAVPVAGWVRHQAAIAEAGHALTTTSTSYAWLCAGIDAQRRGALREAVQWFDRALIEDPGHKRASVARDLTRGKILSATNAHKAADELERALEQLDEWMAHAR